MKFGQNAFVFWVPGFEFNFFYFFFFLLVYRGQLKLWVCEGGLKAVGGRGGGGIYGVTLATTGFDFYF